MDGYERTATRSVDRGVCTLRWEDVVGDEATLRAILPKEDCDHFYSILQQFSAPEVRMRLDNEQLQQELKESGPAAVQRAKRSVEEEGEGRAEEKSEESLKRVAFEEKIQEPQIVGVQPSKVEQAVGSDQDMQI